MNADRRKTLAKIAETIEAAKTDLESIRDEEQEAFDNMPEGMQQGERGTAMEAAVQELDEAIDGLDSALSNIQTATE